MIHIRWVKKIIFATILLLIIGIEAHAQPMINEGITEVDLKHEIIRNCPLSVEQQYFVWQECDKAQLSYDMILAVIKLESGFDSNIISQCGDVGLMQINSTYADWYAELAGMKSYNLTDWKDNIKMGIAGFEFYRDYYRKKGVSDEVMFASINNTYNMGINGFKSYINRTGSVTRAYDRKVYEYKIQFEMEAYNE